MRRVWALAFCLYAGAGVAAETSSGDSRFTMTPANGGFLRLDTRSGAVSFCSVTGEAATCRAAADERAALAAEIDWLSARNADLERGSGKPAPALDATPAPGDVELNRSFDVAETFLRRMMRVMREAERPQAE